MQDFRDLKVWAKSHQLALEVYRATRTFAREELYGLRSQIRRSAASIPCNIAEACGRGGGDFGRFLQIAMGSASELEYQLILTRDLDLLGSAAFQPLADKTIEVKRMLASLLTKLKTDD